MVRWLVPLMSLVVSLCMSAVTAQNTFFQWFPGSATFYGGASGHGSIGGACGYGNSHLISNVGVNNAAAASVLWKGGKGCGGCFEVKCNPAASKKWCIEGKTVTITVTNMCPRGGMGWCNPPRKHFDMSQPSYTQIAKYRSGLVYTLMRRVPCKRSGNIKFKLSGNPWFFSVVIYNVAGYGEIGSVFVQVDNPGLPWLKLRQNWGALYSISRRIYKARMNIRIVLMNGESLLIKKALPSGWNIGGTYSAGQFSSGRSGRRKYANRNLRAINSGSAKPSEAEVSL